MQRTILIFHGTGGSPQGNWFPWLKKELEEKGHRVFVLQFPEPEKPNFAKWYEEFQKYEQYLDENSIIVGHSLGGLFLLRILERISQPIYAAFFVAAPIGVKPIRFYDSDYAFSGFEFNFEKIKSNAKHFFVYHSDNDPYVSLGNGEQLAKQLGKQLAFIPHAGHLNAESGYMKFDKLLQDIETIL